MEKTSIMQLRMGSIPVENLHGDNLNPHNINKLSCSHQSPQESQHLCHPEHCLILVGPEDQSSKIYLAFSNYVENSSSRFYLISCSQVILNSSRRSCYLLLRLLVYMYLSQLMRTFTNYLKCIVISS